MNSSAQNAFFSSRFSSQAFEHCPLYLPVFHKLVFLTGQVVYRQTWEYIVKGFWLAVNKLPHLLPELTMSLFSLGSHQTFILPPWKILGHACPLYSELSMLTLLAAAANGLMGFCFVLCHKSTAQDLLLAFHLTQWPQLKR